LRCATLCSRTSLYMFVYLSFLNVCVRVGMYDVDMQAQRRKKEHWKEEKLAKEEAERVVIDREEAELKRSKRIEAIKRANYILYEQTDKMKGLRSAQLYTDVLEDRKEQLVEKAIKAKWTDDVGGDYYEEMMRQTAEAEAKEVLKDKAREAAIQKNAALQKEQLHDLRERYMAQLRQEKKEGELVIAKSKQEVIEDAEKAAEKSLGARLASEEMTLANQRLKKLQLENSLVEAKEDEKRLADLKKKEQMAIARRDLEAKRFMDKQATRQQMIDKACEVLAQQEQRNNFVAEKQAAEARAKEDSDLASREAKRQWQKNAIEQSRKEVVERKAKLAAQEAEEENDRLARFAKKVEDMDRAEALKQQQVKEKAMNTRYAMEAQMAEKQMWRDADREASLRQDAQTKAVLAEDDVRFRRVAQGVLDEAAAEGKNTIPIEKAMYAKTITLQPASVSMRL